MRKSERKARRNRRVEEWTGKKEGEEVEEGERRGERGRRG